MFLKTLFLTSFILISNSLKPMEPVKPKPKIVYTMEDLLKILPQKPTEDDKEALKSVLKFNKDAKKTLTYISPAQRFKNLKNWEKRKKN